MVVVARACGHGRASMGIEETRASRIGELWFLALLQGVADRLDGGGIAENEILYKRVGARFAQDIAHA